MKRWTILMVVLFALLILGCKSDSDILASYGNGTITRGEFHNWIDAKQWARESILKNKKQQKDKLTMMAIEKIAIQKAKDEGFDTSPDFQAVAEMATESQLMKLLYTKEIKDKANFEEPAIKIRHIFLKVRDFKIQNGKRIPLAGKELTQAFSRAKEKATMIIEELEKGGDFGKLAEKYSDDFSKKKGGDIGYVVRDMLLPEYADAAFKLQEEQFTKEPVVTARGLYIVKVDEKDVITPENIDDIIEDKVQVKRLKNRLYRKTAQKYLDDLTNKDDVEFNEKNVTSRNKDAVVFKVGEKVYTVADMEKRIEMYNKRFKQRLQRAGKDRIDATDEKKVAIANNTFKFELLKREAVKKGIVDDPDYIENVKNRQDLLLAREYMNHIGSKGVTVTPKELMDEYNNNKNERYYTIVKANGKRTKNVEPFSKVKGRIEALIKRKKQAENIRKWREQILEEYKLNINESELEGE